MAWKPKGAFIGGLEVQAVFQGPWDYFSLEGVVTSRALASLAYERPGGPLHLSQPASEVYVKQGLMVW